MSRKKWCREVLATEAYCAFGQNRNEESGDSTQCHNKFFIVQLSNKDFNLGDATCFHTWYLSFCWHFQLKIWHLHRIWCRWQISGKHAFFKKLWTKLYTSFSKVVFTKYFVCTFTIVPNTFLYFSMVTPSMVTLTIFKMGHMLWDHKGRTVSRWHLWVQTVHRWQICHLCL